MEEPAGTEMLRLIKDASSEVLFNDSLPLYSCLNTLSSLEELLVLEMCCRLVELIKELIGTEVFRLIKDVSSEIFADESLLVYLNMLSSFEELLIFELRCTVEWLVEESVGTEVLRLIKGDSPEILFDESLYPFMSRFILKWSGDY